MEQMKVKWIQDNICQSNEYRAGYVKRGRAKYVIECYERSISHLWVKEIVKIVTNERKARQLCRRYAQGEEV